jgi:hypothetical protein
MNRFDEILQAANRFDLSRVVLHYIGNTGLSQEDALEHAGEACRYLAIRATYPTLRFPMIWGPVDEFWHTFLLFTTEYAAFCHSLGSGFLHHFPGPLSPTNEEFQCARQDYERFLSTYFELIGHQPPKSMWPEFDGPNVRWSC